MVNGLPDRVTNLVNVEAANTNAYGDYTVSPLLRNDVSRDNIPVIAQGSSDIAMEHWASQNIPSMFSPPELSPENWRTRRVADKEALLD